MAAGVAFGPGVGAGPELEVRAAARVAIPQHMRWGMFTTRVLVLLAVWRGAGTAAGSRPSWVFIVVLLAATAALGVTGYRGGKNVYEYGVGVRKIALRPLEAPQGHQMKARGVSRDRWPVSIA